MSRIFLSHSSKNNAEALGLRDWLAMQGWHDVFLDIDPERGLVAADRWQKALHAAIGRCRAVIFLLSPEWIESKHCISELDLALHAGAERIGVIIKDIPFDGIPTGLGGENQLVNLTLGGTPVTFAVNPPPERKTVEVTFPEEDLGALRQGLARLGLVGFETESFPWPPPGDPDRAPYRGLEALDVKDAGVFFGRDTDLIRAREHLIRLRGEGGRKLVVIVGASGSGKSSFLRAGLLPRLKREDLDFISLPLLRPGTAALSGKMGLAAALEQAFVELREPRALGDLIVALEDDPDALPPLLNRLQILAIKRLVGEAKPQINRPPTLVLAVDQAEELFAIDSGFEAAKLRQHLAAALTRGPDTIGLLTIRSDRFSLLQEDEQLKLLLEPFNLPPINPTIYREAIFKPAARANPAIAIDPKLPDALIDDTTAEGADPLPLLAFTMQRLYWRYGRVDRYRGGSKYRGLDVDDYNALGGLNGSIDAAINEAFAEPGREPAIPADRKKRERFLKAAFIPGLVDINPTNGEALSRIATEREIPKACRSIVARLVDARLLVSDQGPANADGVMLTTFRVAHEAVLRRWSWLKTLLEQQAGHLITAHLIEQQAEIWDKAGRGKDWLDLRGDRLRDAVALADQVNFRRRLYGVPAAYLDACRRLEQAAAWKRRRGYVAVLALLAGIGGAVATYGQWFPVVDATAYWAINSRKDLSKPGQVFQDCSICPQMVVIPPGSFMMGSQDGEGEPDEHPLHKVTIAYPFAVSKFEITFAQWDACFQAGGCSQKAFEDQGWLRSTLPVINVSWRDAQQYVKWISYIVGERYRLLSESEWEYAARGITDANKPHMAYSWGNEIGTGNANCQNCGSQWDYKQTAPIGSFKPNAFGLHDMHGNVWEWVQDCHKETYTAAPADGSFDSHPNCDSRVLRGGSYMTKATSLSAKNRWSLNPDDEADFTGFRVRREVVPAGALQ